LTHPDGTATITVVDETGYVSVDYATPWLYFKMFPQACHSYNNLIATSDVMARMIHEKEAFKTASLRYPS
jgi:hypothetical protein